LGGEEFSQLDQNERLLYEQLNEIKDELRITRKDRDYFKEKLEESFAKQDNEIIKNIFEKLVLEINWS